MNKGYTKIFRSMIAWEWYTNVETKTLFLHCILKASYQRQSYQGKEIQIGDFISTVEKLSIETGLTVAQVRTAIAHLTKTGELTKKTCNKYTIFSVVNYKLYQQNEDSSQPDNSPQLDNNQQSDNKQNTSNQQTNDKQNTSNQQTNDKQMTSNQQTNDKQMTSNQQTNDKQMTNNQQTNDKQIAAIKEFKESKELKESKERESLNNNIRVGTEEQVPTSLKFSEDSFEMKCVNKLITSCLETCPGSKVPDSPGKKEKWCIEIERMKRLDGRTEEDILKVLEYAISDTFWQSNIRSAGKLREKYEILMSHLRSREKRNKFNNFTPRGVDFKNLEQQLLGY